MSSATFMPLLDSLVERIRRFGWKIDSVSFNWHSHHRLSKWSCVATQSKGLSFSVICVFRLLDADGNPSKLVVKRVDGSHRFAASNMVWKSGDHGNFDGWVCSLFCTCCLFSLSLSLLSIFMLHRYFALFVSTLLPCLAFFLQVLFFPMTPFVTQVRCMIVHYPNRTAWLSDAISK